MTYEIEPLRTCRVCSLSAYTQGDLEFFKSHKNCKYNRERICKDCSNKQSSSYDSYKNWYKDRSNVLMKRYGINQSDYNIILEAQENSCAICGTEDPSPRNYLCVDHNHDTEEVRGLLCHNCNTGLGLFKDSQDNLTKAHKYLSDRGSYVSYKEDS